MRLPICWSLPCRPIPRLTRMTRICYFLPFHPSRGPPAMVSQTTLPPSSRQQGPSMLIVRQLKMTPAPMIPTPPPQMTKGSPTKSTTRQLQHRLRPPPATRRMTHQLLQSTLRSKMWNVSSMTHLRRSRREHAGAGVWRTDGARLAPIKWLREQGVLLDPGSRWTRYARILSFMRFQQMTAQAWRFKQMTDGIGSPFPSAGGSWRSRRNDNSRLFATHRQISGPQTRIAPLSQLRSPLSPSVDWESLFFHCCWRSVHGALDIYI